MVKSKENKIELNLDGLEIIEREAKGFGTGCHVIVPKEYEGKIVKVILLNDENRVNRDKKGGKNEK